MTRYNMLGRPRLFRKDESGGGIARVAVAVSGGPDSVCLLHVLVELAPRLGLELCVAHLNHKLRGKESDEDERFVAGMSARLGLPFHRAAAALSDPMNQGGNLEQDARRARRSFFLALRKGGLADRVALGHTRDDQAETVLFRLLRGAGLAGLAGILPVTAEGIIRPMLAVTRAEVVEYLRSRGIAWREDLSNRDPRFARNRIRAALLPELERDWNPNLGANLAHLADLAYEEERVWARRMDRAAAEKLIRRAGGVECEAGTIAGMPRAVARRLVRRAIAMVKGDLRSVEYSHVEQVLELARRASGEGRLQLPGIEVCRSFDWIRMAPPGSLGLPAAREVSAPGSYEMAEGGRLHLEVQRQEVTQKVTGGPYGTLKTAELCFRRIPRPLELRGWRPGDHYRPAGGARDFKISDLFQRARVPSWRRPFWPIVTGGGKILWARDFGAAEEFAAEAGSTPVLRVWEADAGDG